MASAVVLPSHACHQLTWGGAIQGSLHGPLTKQHLSCHGQAFLPFLPVPMTAVLWGQFIQGHQDSGVHYGVKYSSDYTFFKIKRHGVGKMAQPE